MLLPHVVCKALVAGGQLLGAEQQAMRPGRGKFGGAQFHPGRIACYPATDRRPPATSNQDITHHMR